MDNPTTPPQQSLPSQEANISSADKNLQQNPTKSGANNTSLLKLIAAYGLITGLIGAILLGGFFLTKQQNAPAPSATPTTTVIPTNNHTPTTTIKPTETAEGKFCGGIAGMQCADGYRCKFTCPNGSICDDSQYPYPDAGGICVKQEISPQIVSIIFRGGLCPDGPCSDELIVSKDGSIVKNGNQTNKLNAQQIIQLERLIADTDFTSLKTKKFQGTCPTAYDGQEQIFTFYLSNYEETLGSCTYHLTGPLFDFIDANITQ